MEPIELPREIDQPQTLWFWSIDQVVIFAIMFGLGMMMGHIVLYSIAAMIVCSIFRRHRDSKADGYLLHLLYWIGLVPISGSSVMNPFQRTVLPQ